MRVQRLIALCLIVTRLPATAAFVVQAPAFATAPLRAAAFRKHPAAMAGVATWPILGRTGRAPPMISMAATGGDASDTLNPEKWTEAGAAALQKLPATCKKLNQRVAEAEHLALALLEDEKGMASKVLLAAGAEPKAIKEAFEAFARRQPQVYSSDGSVRVRFLQSAVMSTADESRWPCGGAGVLAGALLPLMSSAPSAAECHRVLPSAAVCLRLRLSPRASSQDNSANLVVGQSLSSLLAKAVAQRSLLTGACHPSAIRVPSERHTSATRVPSERPLIVIPQTNTSPGSMS